MALNSFLPATAADNHRDLHSKRKKKKKNHQPPPQPPAAVKPPILSSWEQFKSLLNCKSAAAIQVQIHSGGDGGAKIWCRPSICSLRDVVNSSTRVVNRPDADHNSSGDSGPLSTGETYPLTRRRRRRLPSEPAGGSRGGMQLMRLSGCYECRAIDAEPALRIYPRTRTLCGCPQCGEVFTSSDSLELHQILRHAELGTEDSGRNIVEIIFMSSWQKKDRPICKIERILKVHNTPRTIARFEDYRIAVKLSATVAAGGGGYGGRQPFSSRRNPRCAADGNELLRFHCASLSCHLGAGDSTALCAGSSSSSAAAACGVCSIILHGFRRPHHPLGVDTTASSSRAHDHSAASRGGGRRAMLVCRVIAGRIRRAADEEGGDGGASGEYDSVVGDAGPYSNIEELYVTNPRAILPCFVVIYQTLN